MTEGWEAGERVRGAREVGFWEHFLGMVWTKWVFGTLWEADGNRVFLSRSNARDLVFFDHVRLWKSFRRLPFTLQFTELTLCGPITSFSSANRLEIKILTVVGGC